MNKHPNQWSTLQSAVVNQRVPQAMLFVGPLHCHLPEFTTQVMQLLFCKTEQQKPCLQCINCQMVQQEEYPDLEWVKPEKSGGAIKIDQIRELHHSAYLTPQKSQHRVIVIEAADRMNTASANALLKILEEPAQHTVFILLAQQLSTVLPTIISRCHLTHFSATDDSTANNLLSLGAHYPAESERAALMNQAETILDGLLAVLEGKEHPCLLASRLNQFEPANLFWFLHLVYSQIMYMHAAKHTMSGPAVAQLTSLYTKLNPILIYQQMDKINGLIRKLNHNMNINYTLVLEDLLLSLGKT